MATQNVPSLIVRVFTDSSNKMVTLPRKRSTTLNIAKEILSPSHAATAR